MKNTYLHRVYRYNRKVFFFILLFAGGTLLCNITGFEITPFFVWGMYSQPERPAGQYEILQTKTGDGMVIDPSAGYTDDTRFYLNAPLAWYRTIRDNGDTEPTRTFLEKELQGRYRWLGLREGKGPLSAMENKVFNGQSQLLAFPGWYRRYLTAVTGIPIQSLFVSVLRVHYDANEHIAVDSTFLFDTWSNPRSN